MEHFLSLELVGKLISCKELHARFLAKSLNTNHMTVARRLNELVSQNVLDFRREGRNKTYFLKKTAEARAYVMMAEHEKLVKALGMYPELRNIVHSIQSNPEIKLAVIFGSYAKGSATEESDIDLYVETKERSLKSELELLNTRLSVKTGTYDQKNPLIKEINRNHVIVKGVELFHEKSGLFK